MDDTTHPPTHPPTHPAVEVTASRETPVGDETVRRALPRAGRRTVGAWCFADHFGPRDVGFDGGLNVAPHPHCGLQTVTWLVDGEGLHRDSLGTEQPIRAGELNLMTAGHGVSHSEEPTGRFSGRLHGVQLWLAQPEATRHGPAAFEHHTHLPEVEMPGATATVLVGDLAGVTSPARRDTPLVGADLRVRQTTTVPLDPTFEHSLVVLDGAVRVDSDSANGASVGVGQSGYLSPGRAEVRLTPLTTDGAHVVLLGGTPFESAIVMSWNFVGRTREELEAAHRSWNDDDGRFGTVASPLTRIPAPPPVWRPTN